MVNSFVGLGLFVKWVCEKTKMRMKAEVGSNESESFVLLLRLYMVVTVCVREKRNKEDKGASIYRMVEDDC